MDTRMAKALRIVTGENESKALDEPTPWTNRSKLAVCSANQSRSAAAADASGLGAVSEALVSPRNKMRRKGTMLRKVNSESNAFSRLKNALAKRFHR